jgi:hypothetical protein
VGEDNASRLLYSSCPLPVFEIVICYIIFIKWKVTGVGMIACLKVKTWQEICSVGGKLFDVGEK